MPNYTSYKKSNYGYDVDGALKTTALEMGHDADLQDGDMVMVQRSDGEWKAFDLDYINESIEACEDVADYENTTRYNFWNDLKTKATSLNVEKLTLRKKGVKEDRAELKARRQPGYTEPLKRPDRDAIANQLRR